MNKTLLRIGYWHIVAVGLLLVLTRVSYAATAVNDVYTIDLLQGTQNLVVAYNDVVFLETDAAVDAAKIIAVSTPSEGTVEINQSDFLSVNYTPPSSPSGSPVTFTYTLQDLLGTSQPATVTIDILQSSVQLTANDDQYVSSGQPVLIYPIENDLIPSTLSASSATITFASLSANQGTIVAQSAAANLFIYTPPENLALVEGSPVILTYMLTVPGEQQVQANVTISVNGSLSPLVNESTQEKERSVGEVVEVACAINNAGLSSSQAFTDTCAILLALPASEIPGALRQLIPDQISQQANDTHQVATANVDNIQQRIGNLRAGNIGFSFAGLKAMVNGKALALGDIIDGELRGGAAGDEVFAGTRLSGFVTGSITTGEKDDADGLDGYDFESQMLTLGADYRLTNELFLGLALGFGDTTSESDAGSSEFDSKTVSLSFYGNWYPRKNMYVDWVVGYSDNDYDSIRKISFGTVQSTASGDTEGHQVSVSSSVGWEMSINHWMITGYGRAGYIESTLDGYEESDSAGLALSLEQQVIRTVPISLGANVERAFSFPFGVLIPQAELELIKDLNDDPRTVKASFVSAPEAGSFSASTASPDTDYMEASLSLTAVFKGGLMAFIRYGTEISREDYNISTIEAGARMEF